jgi:hypothetical protein
LCLCVFMYVFLRVYVHLYMYVFMYYVCMYVLMHMYQERTLNLFVYGLCKFDISRPGCIMSNGTQE